MLRKRGHFLMSCETCKGTPALWAGCECRVSSRDDGVR